MATVLSLLDSTDYRYLSGSCAPKWPLSCHLIPSKSVEPAKQVQKKAIITGGGPAGLTASWELAKHGFPAVVLEASSQVGGIARTVNYKGYLFDIGGHRFFTKWDEVFHLWEEILGDKFLERPRLSRIYYRKRYFYYPIRPLNALLGLGIIECIRVVLSFIHIRLFPFPTEDNFEQWVSNRFGKRLYQIFFKTYTEKVWGIPCNQIQADWAAQRIKGLSLASAIKAALLKPKGSKIKTLIDRFHYPERGPGMMWERLTERLQSRGYPVCLEKPVVKIHHNGHSITRVVTKGSSGEETFEGTHFISTMPIRHCVRALDPPAPPAILDAANGLRYRDFLIVSLIINRKELFPDNWIYVHSPDVLVGRIQNFKNWSPAMVPDPNKTCLGMEYFVFVNDALWSMPDAELVALAAKEIEKLGLAKATEVEDGAVVRVPKAYPMYDPGYRERVEKIRRYLERFPNLQLVGRNGMHKYNNQDHSMMTALGAARNILGGKHDLWAINTEPEYHEEKQKDREPAYAEPTTVEADSKLEPESVRVSQ